MDKRNVVDASISSPPIPHFTGSERELIKAPHLFFLRMTQNYGDIVQYRHTPEPAILLNHPDYAQHVLVTNGRNYNKNTYLNKYMLEALTGQGLLTSENPLWRKQRRLMQPAFHRQRLIGFFNLIIAAAERTVDRIERFAQADQPFDMAAEMMRLTLDIVTGALFGFDIGPFADSIGEAMETLVNIARPKHPRVKAAIRTLDEIVFEIIDRRRSDPDSTAVDLLAMLLQARYEDGTPMSDQQVRDEVMSLLVAGHETTANTLSWTWYLLGRAPAVTARLRQEIEGVLHGRPLAPGDLPRLTLTEQVVKESMRLYPSAWSLSRRALGEDEIGGFHIPAGAVVALSPYTLHRHPAFWPDPERFDPARFTPEAEQKRHRFAYIPFGGGARKCIGDQFALMENLLILPLMLQRFHFTLASKQIVEGHAVVTLRPKNGILMRAERI